MEKGFRSKLDELWGSKANVEQQLKALREEKTERLSHSEQPLLGDGRRQFIVRDVTPPPVRTEERDLDRANTFYGALDNMKKAVETSSKKRKADIEEDTAIHSNGRRKVRVVSAAEGIKVNDQPIKSNKILEHHQRARKFLPLGSS
jgi:hypothetical protein